MPTQTIKLEATLNWHEWVSWNDLLRDVRSDRAAPNPPSGPGVYEVKHSDQEKRLVIGKASDIRSRLKQGLVKGKLGHPPGDRLREDIKDFSTVQIRWAVTVIPAAVEEHLLQQHKIMFNGDLPTYVHSI